MNLPELVLGASTPISMVSIVQVLRDLTFYYLLRPLSTSKASHCTALGFYYGLAEFYDQCGPRSDAS